MGRTMMERKTTRCPINPRELLAARNRVEDKGLIDDPLVGPQGDRWPRMDLVVQGITLGMVGAGVVTHHEVRFCQ